MISQPLIEAVKRTTSHAVRNLNLAMQSKQIKDYQGAVEALNNLQSNSQYLKSPSAKPKAETNIAEVTKFLNRSGLSLNDLNKLPVVHVTGTNGKGTTCAYCETILRKHGFKTGFYSSPHLLDICERIRIDGKPISKVEFAKYFWRIHDLLDSKKELPGDMPLYFRFLTVMAFHIFLEHKVDVVILEVGIGGTYDCTNIVRNTVVAGITPLDLDHTSILGSTLEQIAWNKSGIMKEGCLAFSVKQPENVLKVFRNMSIEKKCSLTIIDKDYYTSENNSRIPIHVQRTNASLALAISEAFVTRVTNNNSKFSLALAKKCIEETLWPGRYEIKQFRNIRFFLDGAHTLESICVCTNWFEAKTKLEVNKRVLIFNLTGDRNPDMFFNELHSCNFDVVMFIPNIGCQNRDRADLIDYVQTEEKQLKRCEDYKSRWSSLENKCKNPHQKVLVLSSFSEAADYLNDGSSYDCLVTGSLHLIGVALSIIDPTLNGILDN